MAIRFLLDECIRDKKLWTAIQQHNQANPLEPIESIRVGDIGAPPSGAKDPEVVTWAASEGWVIVSQDASTLRKAHDDFVAEGGCSPGLLLMRDGFTIPEIVEDLFLIANYSELHEWANRADFIPLSEREA